LSLDAGVIKVKKGRAVSRPQPIVTGYHEDFPAVWSPNGKWIAFHSHRSITPVSDYFGPGSTDDIYLRKADDRNAREIRLTDFGQETGSPFWSPDGSQLIFQSEDKHGPRGVNKIWVLTLDPESGRVLRTAQLPLPANILNTKYAAWSPDGRQIAIEDDRGGDDRALWIVDANGHNESKVLDYKGTTFGGVDWMRDGRTLVFSALADGRLQILTVPRAGGVARHLSNDPGNLLHPRVSPDGRWIACSRLIQSHQIWRAPLQELIM